MNTWKLNSWATKPSKQQVNYPSEAALQKTLQQLTNLPPLITHLEIEALKIQLREATLGQRFLLQGGDCTKNFSDCHATQITNKLKIILQMSLILIHGLKKPVTRIGRIAGQYAKPRSEEFETID